jgi:transposase
MEFRTIIGYSESFKIHVVNEVESCNLTKSEASRKYNILGHSTVLKWCRKYGSLAERKKEYNSKKSRISMSTEEYEILRLKNEIQSLKSELEDSRLKNVVLETMVDIAEKEFDIPIKKKYGVKQYVK